MAGGGYGGPLIQPDDSWIRINTGEATTTSRSVTLYLFCRWAGQMRIADGTDPSAATWETYARTKAWTLPDVDGTKTVCVEFRGYENNLSAIATDTITLDEDGVPSTFRELMAADMNDVALVSTHFAEELDYYDQEGTLECSCLGVMDTQREEYDDRMGGGRRSVKTARLALSYADVPSPQMGDYIILTQTGERWDVELVLSNDRIAGVDLQMIRREKIEASPDDFRRK